MEKLIIEEICDKVCLTEKVLIKIFKKTFIKAYHIGRIDCWNSKK